LDTLANKFFEATGDLRDSIYEEASSLADQAGEAYRHYIRVMEKVVSGSEEYLEKETKRWASFMANRGVDIDY
jgi:protein disulfide-isomerase A6